MGVCPTRQRRQEQLCDTTTELTEYDSDNSEDIDNFISRRRRSEKFFIVTFYAWKAHVIVEQRHVVLLDYCEEHTEELL